MHRFLVPLPLPPPRRRRAALAVALGVIAVAFGAVASAAGPGGWDHLGDLGTPGTDSLNGHVNALNAGVPGKLYVGGMFTDAGGHADADRIAVWNGTSWSPVSSPTSQISNGGVFAIALAGGKVYAGGTFLNAGGNADADFLAVWDGASWAPFCNAVGPAFGANVNALAVAGSTLYVGGSFQDGAGIAAADYLLACDLSTGASSVTTNPASPLNGPVHALTADSNGALYAGGLFSNVDNIAAADNVAFKDGSGWHAMGSGGGPCGCAVSSFVRSLTAAGTDVYVGTDAKDVAGIPQADNVAKWNGSAWSALGADATSAGGWFPASTFIYALTTSGSSVFAAGSFQNADGNPLADHVARFKDGSWGPVGSNGAGNGPWIGSGNSLAVLDGRLYAGGSFTSAGGDDQAAFAASFPISGPSAPDTTISPVPAITSNRRPTVEFSSSQTGSTFKCWFEGPGGLGTDKGGADCTSPFQIPTLSDGVWTFTVWAVSPGGVADATPASVTFEVDATPPVVKIDSGPAEGSVIPEGSKPTFAFSSDGTALAFQCSLDGSPAGTCTSPHTTLLLASGEHTFVVYGVDRVGNVASARRAFKVGAADKTAPAVVLSGRSIQAAGATIAVVVSCPSEACTAVASGTVSVPGAARIFRLRATTKRIGAGSKATLKLRVPVKAQAAIRRALRRNRKVTAKIAVRVKDAAGNARTRSRSVRIKRSRR